MSSVSPFSPKLSYEGERGFHGASDYAKALLRSLGIPETRLIETSPIHPALANANSGLMSITGPADGPPQVCPAQLATCAEGVLLAIQTLAPDIDLNQLSGPHLLTERAALMGLSRNGRIAPGASCHLLDAKDGRIAINLAREDDWAMLPAWLESDAISGDVDQWQDLASLVSKGSVGELVSRGRLMGLAVAPECLPTPKDQWFDVLVTGDKRYKSQTPLVLDLSSLWAGPLCTHLLHTLGARVIKVESTHRPDGARNGNADFYDLLNAGKQSLGLDLKSAHGQTQLKKLISQADIVIESSRPRALRQMGIVAEDMVAARPGLSWISITAYGRRGAQADWVGFGDDVGVAAGLSGLMSAVSGESMFVGDAIADPLTGMHAALLAWSSYLAGGGQLISVPMHDVTAHCVGWGLPTSAVALQEHYRQWADMVSLDEVAAPKPRYASASAQSLGADNAALIAEFSL
ncbi:MAG: CoA transferase [Salinisphaeraceae bacterium]|nr:CoA transferase [Salinisphaeraceae bacterium]